MSLHKGQLDGLKGQPRPQQFCWRACASCWFASAATLSSCWVQNDRLFVLRQSPWRLVPRLASVHPEPPALHAQPSRPPKARVRVALVHAAGPGRASAAAQLRRCAAHRALHRLHILPGSPPSSAGAIALVRVTQNGHIWTTSASQRRPGWRSSCKRRPNSASKARGIDLRCHCAYAHTNRLSSVMSFVDGTWAEAMWFVAEAIEAGRTEMAVLITLASQWRVSTPPRRCIAQPCEQAPAPSSRAAEPFPTYRPQPEASG